MNVCLSTKDSINRTGSQSKILLSYVIRNNNRVAELSDAYRSNHDDDGYTWKHGNNYLRIDYIFVSNILLSKITGASVDWAFESSDHASV
jgi:exonuclease III